MAATATASGGTFGCVPITMREEGGGWVRVLMGDESCYGDVLFDFSGDNMPEYKETQDGSPRLVIHNPSEGDAIVYIQMHDRDLTIIPEDGVKVSLVDGKVVFKF
jgi:hypothetical protein